MSENLRSEIKLIEIECHSTTSGAWGIAIFLIAPAIIGLIYTIGTRAYSSNIDPISALVIGLISLIYLASFPMMFFGRRYKGVISLPQEREEVAESSGQNWRTYMDSLPNKQE